MHELPASFGKYFLTEKIATGGMAEIYLGKLIGPGGFEKQLVIKQIHPELGGKPAFVDLFVAEAKTLVSLSHGNIVPIYELGLVDERYFIAMEYIDGPTLDRLQRALAARGQAMAPALAAHITAEILKGLDYAHRKGEGVIHRDLSPRNVMLSRDGEVKLVDFGIAVPLGHERERHGGAPVGSFPYMSPEQVRGERLTGQSDVFSAGVLLWEMLVGRSLFARASAEDTLSAVTDAPIAPPSAQRSEVPAALDAICARALARDPAARYPSAAACLTDVQRYLYSLAEPVAPVTLSRTVAACCPPIAQRAAVEAAAAALAATGAMNAAAGIPDIGPGTVPLPRRGGAGEGDAPGEAGEAPEHVGDAGDAGRTMPFDRPRTHARADAGTRPHGRRRSATEQSFATHVDIERVLSGTAPAPRPGNGHEQAASGAADAIEPAAVSDQVVQDAPTPRPDARRGARRVWLAAAGLALAGAAILAFALRTSGLPGAPAATNAQPVAPGAADAPRPAPGAAHPESTLAAAPAPAAPALRADRAAPDASVQAAPAAPGNAPGATRPEAPARGAARRDAVPAPGSPGRRRPAPAARPEPATAAVPDGDARSRPAAPGDGSPTRTAGAGTGMLKVGANPWAEVYLDGTRLGRTPSAWPVPAGTHVVEVVFPVGDPPPRRRFSVDIAPGETESLGVVDFSDGASAKP